jgi:predicted HTH transcriptional regulator
LVKQGKIDGQHEERRKAVYGNDSRQYSAETHPNAVMSDLNPALIDQFRAMWLRKSGKGALSGLSPQELLEDAGLTQDGKLTVAALTFMGTRTAMRRYLAQAEVIFEYRSNEASLAFQQRIEYCEGFLGILDSLWTTLNLRNETLHYREGLFVGDIPAFNESVVREAILNANPREIAAARGRLLNDGAFSSRMHTGSQPLGTCSSAQNRRTGHVAAVPDANGQTLYTLRSRSPFS